MTTRSSLAIVGVVGVVLGLAAGYGLTMLIGTPFTTLEQVGWLSCCFSLALTQVSLGIVTHIYLF